MTRDKAAILLELRSVAKQMPSVKEEYYSWRREQVRIVFSLRRLSATAKLVYVVLIETYQNRQPREQNRGLAWPAQDTLAQRIGSSQKSVSRAIDDLQRNGLIMVGAQLGRHRANLIAFPTLTEEVKLTASRRQIDRVKRTIRPTISSISSSNYLPAAARADQRTRKQTECKYRKFEKAFGQVAYEIEEGLYKRLTELYMTDTLSRSRFIDALNGTAWETAAWAIAHQLELTEYDSHDPETVVPFHRKTGTD